MSPATYRVGMGSMNDDDPLSLRRGDLDEEDLEALGADDPDDMSETTSDAMRSADSAEPFLPATDPPVVPGGRDGIEVAQGFAATSEGAEERAGTPGDDEISERVLHLLRTDAATAGLQLEVQTVGGTVYLRGMVADLDDTDLATEVAARVPGVVDVVDDTTVQQ